MPADPTNSDVNDWSFDWSWNQVTDSDSKNEFNETNSIIPPPLQFRSTVEPEELDPDEPPPVPEPEPKAADLELAFNSNDGESDEDGIDGTVPVPVPVTVPSSQELKAKLSPYLQTMKRSEMEKLVLDKITDVVKKKLSVEDLNRKLLETNIYKDKLFQKVTNLQHQVLDLSRAVQSVSENVGRTRTRTRVKDSLGATMRIVRSVGVQVMCQGPLSPPQKSATNLNPNPTTELNHLPLSKTTVFPSNNDPASKSQSKQTAHKPLQVLIETSSGHGLTDAALPSKEALYQIRQIKFPPWMSSQSESESESDRLTANGITKPSMKAPLNRLCTNENEIITTRASMAQAAVSTDSADKNPTPSSGSAINSNPQQSEFVSLPIRLPNRSDKRTSASASNASIVPETGVLGRLVPIIHSSTTATENRAKKALRFRPILPRSLATTTTITNTTTTSTKDHCSTSINGASATSLNRLISGSKGGSSHRESATKPAKPSASFDQSKLASRRRSKTVDRMVPTTDTVPLVGPSAPEGLPEPGQEEAKCGPPDEGNTLPPPQLIINFRADGIVLSWTVNLGPNRDYHEIQHYQLMACKQPSPFGMKLSATEHRRFLESREWQWKLVGNVQSVPLPMCCQLSQFEMRDEDCYCFRIRGVDMFNRAGPYSAIVVVHNG